ncbi:hypothetical protein ACLK19_23380 [Escherichia coli]
MPHNNSLYVIFTIIPDNNHVKKILSPITVTISVSMVIILLISPADKIRHNYINQT